MPIQSQTDHQAVLSVGNEGDALVLKQLENGRHASVQEAGLFHIAFLLDGVTQLGAFIKHIAAKRIPIGGGDHLVSEAVYFNDPEGNGIEVYIDRASDTWQWRDGLVKMDTLQLDVDHILERSGDTTWEGMGQGARIGHLHLKTNDLEAARTFYGDIAFKVVSTFPKAYFMSDQQYHHHIAVNMWQSNQVRQEAATTYGLAEFNIVSPNSASNRLTTPEGLTLTINQ